MSDPGDGSFAALKATEQPIDTSTAVGKSFLDMLGVFAEFETNPRREASPRRRRRACIASLSAYDELATIHPASPAVTP